MAAQGGGAVGAAGAPAAAPAAAGYTERDFAYYELVAKEAQEQQSVKSYLDITQLAFRTCVHSFLHQELTGKEQKCITAVTKKYAAAAIRATARFGEAQALAARDAAAAAPR